MLQKLNERIQGIFAWVVISLIAVTFAFFGIDYYMQARNHSEVQVEVNGTPILKQAFDLTLRRALQFSPQQLTANKEQALKKQVLSDMVKNTIRIQAAHKSGFGVSDNQANQAILSIPQFQEDGKFSAERYQQALSNAYFTPQTFQQEVQQGMLLNQQRFAFVGTAFVSPAEVENFISLYMQKRSYTYLEIPTSAFITQTSPNAKVIQQYYQQHQDVFIDPEKVSIEYLQLSLNDLKQDVHLTPEQITNFYNENRGNYQTPARWQVEHILFALKPDASPEDIAAVKARAMQGYQQLQANPKDFALLAKKLSDDKLATLNPTATWLVAGQTPFDDELVKLTQPGEISAPIKSTNGFEIFQLKAYEPARIKPLAEVEEMIRTQLTNELAQNKYAQDLEKLSDLSYQTPDSLEAVAQAVKLPLQVSAPFAKQGGDVALTKNKQVINAAFSQDVLAQGNNSEPLQINADTVVVLRVKQHYAAKLQPFNQVKNAIVKTLDQQQAAKKASAFGQQLLKMSDAAAVNAQIAQHNLAWQIVKDAKRDDATNNYINELAFNLSKPNSTIGQPLSNGDYVIVKLDTIQNGNEKDLDKEQLTGIQDQLAANNGLTEYELYINGLMSKAKIK